VAAQKTAEEKHRKTELRSASYKVPCGLRTVFFYGPMLLRVNKTEIFGVVHLYCRV